MCACENIQLCVCLMLIRARLSRSSSMCAHKSIWLQLNSSSVFSLSLFVCVFVLLFTLCYLRLNRRVFYVKREISLICVLCVCAPTTNKQTKRDEWTKLSRLQSNAAHTQNQLDSIWLELRVVCVSIQMAFKSRVQLTFATKTNSSSIKWTWLKLGHRVWCWN